VRITVLITGYEAFANLHRLESVARERGVLPPYRVEPASPALDGAAISGELNPCFNEDKDWP